MLEIAYLQPKDGNKRINKHTKMKKEKETESGKERKEQF
jgi:hypothetical protein